MTIGQHIAALRGLIRQFSDAETPFTDEFLYHLFRTSANLLMSRKMDKNNNMSTWLSDFYCMKLVPGKVHDCDCIDAGCDVLKTEHPVPKPMRGKYRDLIKVLTINNDPVGYVDASTWTSVQYDPVRKNKLHFSMVNGHIIIWNADVTRVRPKAIFVTGYFEDPVEWSKISACDINGEETGNSCFDIYTSEYPIDSDLVDAAYSLVLDKLRLPLQIPEDKRNQSSAL
jgi:hypothetical protein